MSRKITLIEYDSDIYAGDTMEPDIQYRELISQVLGSHIITDEEVSETDFLEAERRIEDMRQYAYVISSSSSSSSLSSSSAAAVEELFEYHESGGDTSITIGQTGYSEKCGQTFTPDISHTLSKVELELFDNQGDGITGDIDIKLYATSGGLPTGSPLVSGTIDAADLNPAHMSGIYNSIYYPSPAGGVNFGSLCFSPDGLKMYLLVNLTDYGEFDDGWHIFQYSLSIPWDVSTLEYVGCKRIETYGAIYYSGLFISPDGLNLYTIGIYYVFNANLFQIYLGTEWDITSVTGRTATEIFIYISVSYPDIFFSSDGTKIFYTDNYNETVFADSLSTPWDATTLSGTPYDSQDITADNNISGLAFSSDGKIMIVAGRQYDKLYFYNLTTAWSFTGISKDSYEMDISGYVTSAEAMFCKPNAKRFLVSYDNKIWEFNIPQIHGDWHECDMGTTYEVEAETEYFIDATYADYEEGVSEPEWVYNADGDDNYTGGTMLRYDGGSWYDS